MNKTNRHYSWQRIYKMIKQKNSIFLLIVMMTFAGQAVAKKCFHLESYHQDYAWSYKLTKALNEQLKGKCEIVRFDMDTKRNKSEAYKKQIALKAKAKILAWQPDIIIATDDNASKYVIKPFFKDHRIPVVFAGINWNVDAYGYPYSNATGMVEVAPIQALLKKAKWIHGSPKNAFYIGANVISEEKNLQRFKEVTKKLNIELHYKLVNTTQEWIEAYKNAQNYDFVIIGSNAGINDWNKKAVIKEIIVETKKLSITVHDWVMDYTILGLTKLPEEQGDWAGKVVIAIFGGVSPSEIPIVSNRKWDVWVNENILSTTTIAIPKKLLKIANKISKTQ